MTPEQQALDKETSDALSSVARKFAPQETADPTPSAAMREARMRDPNQHATVRQVPRQAPDVKLTPVEHLQGSVERLEKAFYLLEGLAESLTGSTVSRPEDRNETTRPGGMFNELHRLSDQVEQLASLIEREVALVRDWI